MSPARVPQQARSRETVERVLQATEEEIGELGLAAASTTSIARRAGVSVGAVYRFFGDKQAIAEALATRYLTTVSADFTRLAAEVQGPRSFGAVVGKMVEVASTAQLTHPGYYRLTEDVGPELDESPAHEVRQRLVALFVEALRPHVDEPVEGLTVVVELCIETVRNTLAHAPRDPRGRQRTIAELTTMLAGYLAARFPQ